MSCHSSSMKLLFLLSFSLILISSTEILKINKNSSLVLVELLVYSGTENPKWLINSDQYKLLEQEIFSHPSSFLPSTRVMGYKGFKLTFQSNSPTFKIVKHSTSAELFLLKTMKENLPLDVFLHIMQQITNNIEYQSAVHWESSSVNYPKFKKFLNDVCDITPVLGPDTIPDYNPAEDDNGCFEERQWDNNCYNYGNDVVSNTFAQPGRGSGSKWEKNTCEDVQRAAESDGLKWVGRDYPGDKPEIGHYIALLIWPGINFHWVRLDSNGKWSHKPGGSEVRNTDNAGNYITDPSTQDFSPWSEFCGYFLTVPSKININ